MNEQEKQVVQAAIRLRRRIPGMDARERIALEAATWDLITSCQQCNTERHLCPGCGIDLEHGDTACNNCAPAVAGASATRVDGTELDKAPRTIWVPRTMVDVRAGDVIRMPGQPGTERTVHSAVALPWHVHPAADLYRPNEMPAEWPEIKVRFEDSGSPFSFAPTMAVEIELTPEEVAAIELLGWENRLRVEAS